jgi:hypothetical protein
VLASLGFARDIARANRSSGSALQVSNCDQIAICDRTNVSQPERYESLRLSGCKNELDIKTIRRVDIDHSAQISASQPVLREIAIEDNCVEEIEHWLARERRDEVREISSVRNHPDRHDRRLTTRRSGEASTDFELLTERASLSLVHLAGPAYGQQRFAE